jgi:hypothetical protein
MLALFLAQIGDVSGQSLHWNSTSSSTLSTTLRRSSTIRLSRNDSVKCLADLIVAVELGEVRRGDYRGRDMTSYR